MLPIHADIVTISSVENLLNLMDSHYNRSIYGWNDAIFEISGITIPLWSHFYFPLCRGSYDDNIGFVIQPSMNGAPAIIGIAQGVVKAKEI